MTDSENYIDGWAVRVSMPIIGGGMSHMTYYAAFPTAAEAEDAVRATSHACSDTKVTVIGKVPEITFRSHGVKASMVSQWIDEKKQF